MDNRISFSVSTEDSSHQLVQFSFVGREQRTESVQCSVGGVLASADLSVQSLLLCCDSTTAGGQRILLKVEGQVITCTGNIE